KSTTLYAALNLLRSPGRNIITVEDPVEYMLEGVNQVQVHPKAGLTFAGCLRSILRQDPDIIMVGEIRDGETAEIALKAAHTGYKGRVGIYELLPVEGPIREAIYSGARAEDVKSLARTGGFRTMQEDALQKVREGVTALGEVRRVILFDSAKVERCESCSREV